MQCVKCGKNFASHTDGPEICWDCYMKDYDDYVKNNFSEVLQIGSLSNCDMPLPQGFGKQEGWICPVCGRGLAPWVSFCPCQSDLKITYGTSTNETYDIQSYLEQTRHMIKTLDSESGLDEMRKVLKE